MPEGDKIPFYHFSEDAQEVFYSWLKDLQEKIQSENASLMVEHLSKYRSLMPSLALIFHLINVASGDQLGGPVTLMAAELFSKTLFDTSIIKLI